MPIPLFDTRTPIQPLRDAIQAKIAEVIDAQSFILGPELEAFESELADYLGARHVVGVGNGTDAITLALRAMGVGPGDEVVVPSFTFYASAEAIPLTGARPVFCDVDPETFCVTPETVRAAMTPNERRPWWSSTCSATSPPWPRSRRSACPCSRTPRRPLGSRAPAGRPGTLGTAATLSFFPSKNLGAFGDGGAVVTGDDEIAERVRMLRFHGSRDKQTFELVGHNSRLDGLQAGILRVLLPHLEGWADGRRAAARPLRGSGARRPRRPPAAARRSRLAPVRDPPRRAPTSWRPR